MVVAPGGAIVLEAGATHRRDRMAVGAQGGPWLKNQAVGRSGRRRASVMRDKRSGSTPQACAQHAMFSLGGAASSIGFRARRFRRPQRGLRPSRPRRDRSGKRPARAKMRAIRLDRDAARPEGGALSSSRRPRRRSRPTPSGGLRHRNQRQDEIVAETLNIELLPAGQDRLFGGGFDQPEIRAVTPAVNV